MGHVLRGAVMVGVLASATMAAPFWGTFGRNAQHAGTTDVATQALTRIRWQTPVDRHPAYFGDLLLAHYGSPLVTATNTIIVPVKLSTAGKFRVEAHRGSDGRKLWAKRSDWVPPPASWLPTFSPVISPNDRLWMPGAAGTVMLAEGADLPGRFTRMAYYGDALYRTHRRTLRSMVMVNTPLTADAVGHVYFGVFVADAANPAGLESTLVKIHQIGTVQTVTPAEMTGDPTMTQVVHNAAPALSSDGSRLYVAVSNGLSGWLVALDTSTLATIAAVPLVDPASGLPSVLPSEGTSSAMIGPNGDVFFGVLEAPFGARGYRGWMLHFDADLNPAGAPGGFGWDNTPSVVPASAVPSYGGSSPYVLLTKYNEYAGIGVGQGLNRMAILDPGATMLDPVSAIPAMAEVLTVLGPTPDLDHIAMFPSAVREWCVNTAVVDPATSSVLVNNEDGMLHRWDLTTNTLTQSVVLTAGIGEAYTPVVAGADGTVYAINDAILFAVGE